MKIHSVDGYSEVGKNMTVLETGDDAFVFDQGLYLPAVVELEEKERNNYNERLLRRVV
jgi:mRNA degradation ribonuclease J1/J2